MATYYKTTITITVLSDGPYHMPDGLNDIDYDITNGDCVGGFSISSSDALTEEQVREELVRLGSDPEFFGLEKKDEA